MGRKSLKWVPLEAETAAEAQEEFRSLLVERSENRLRPIGLSPLLRDYGSVYLERQATSGKKPDTLVTERGHINKWIEAIGHLRLDKIRAYHISNHLHALRKAKKSARTCNLSLVCLRNVFRAARVDGHLKISPAEGLVWFKTEKKAHRLYSAGEIDRLAKAATAPRFTEGRVAEDNGKGTPLKNAAQFCDYIRFLQYSGAREQEALRVRWQDVDLERGHVMIGAEGDSKKSRGSCCRPEPAIAPVAREHEKTPGAGLSMAISQSTTRRARRTFADFPRIHVAGSQGSRAAKLWFSRFAEILREPRRDERHRFPHRLAMAWSQGWRGATGQELCAPRQRAPQDSGGAAGLWRKRHEQAAGGFKSQEDPGAKGVRQLQWPKGSQPLDPNEWDLRGLETAEFDAALHYEIAREHAELKEALSLLTQPRREELQHINKQEWDNENHQWLSASHATRRQFYKFWDVFHACWCCGEFPEPWMSLEPMKRRLAVERFGKREPVRLVTREEFLRSEEIRKLHEQALKDPQQLRGLAEMDGG